MSGPSCSDPGRPPDARENFTSFELGNLVHYVCSRPGYKPKPPYPLKCVVVNNTVQWNGTVPECIGTYHINTNVHVQMNGDTNNYTAQGCQITRDIFR